MLWWLQVELRTHLRHKCAASAEVHVAMQVSAQLGEDAACSFFQCTSPHSMA
jgi:hypothetical protein